MKDTRIADKHSARVATVALMVATALLAISFEADGEIAGAVFYGAFVASVINALAFFSYSLLRSDSKTQSRTPRANRFSPSPLDAGEPNDTTIRFRGEANEARSDVLRDLWHLPARLTITRPA